jgi:hypothetical protein
MKVRVRLVLVLVLVGIVPVQAGEGTALLHLATT